MDGIIIIKNVKVRFLTTKEDKYENEISYFKLVDKNIENKLAVINKEGYKTPYFKTDDGKILLKCKNKYVKVEVKKDDPINCEIHFKYFKMEDFEGYYMSCLKN